MRVKKLHGIILHQSPLGDNDRSIRFFSKEEGIVPVLAKGVRRTGSHRSFHLDLLNFVQLEIEISRGVKYVREVTLLDAFAILKQKTFAFTCACVMSSFLLRIVPSGVKDAALFTLTLRTFRSLNRGKDSRQTLRNYFLKALRMLGHLPHVVKKNSIRTLLVETLEALDPQLIFMARRTLATFSKSERTRSS